ncbi:MAG: cobalamin-dependent protein, partial [Candidatus Methanomethylophilus sp.]|nr:cobalamin-dependent protein [Methanomethylophilus sp.]
QGDVHDIGKNIVKTMLTAGGYIVKDYGKDVAPGDIADGCKKEKTQVICLSTLMTPTMDNMAKTVALLRENGYRGSCTVTIGGPPTSAAFAVEIGADHRDESAGNCVKWLSEHKPKGGN